MNISKLPVLCLLTTVLAFAQSPVEEQHPAPVSPEVSVPPVALEAAPVSSSSEVVATFLPIVALSSSSEAIVETKPTAPEGKTIFDSVRGNAYNQYGTVGAASTVEDLITTPSDINGQRFFYVSPTDRLGYSAFGIGSGTAMLGLDNSPLGSPAALILGYANSAFGIALNYSVAKVWLSDSESRGRRTSPGDNIELYLSMPLGSATIYANGGWLTTDTNEDKRDGHGSFVEEDDVSKTTLDDSQITANVGITDKLGSMSYDLYLNVTRAGVTRIIDGDKFIDEDSYLAFTLNFNMGYTALQNSTARVIVGANSYFYMEFYDKTTNRKGDNKIGFITIPNILAELCLFDNWLAFAGTRQALHLKAGDGDRDSKTSELSIRHSDISGAFAGIRYQRTNWAVEAQISTDVFYDPFIGFADKVAMFTSFGGFIYF